MVSKNYYRIKEEYKQRMNTKEGNPIIFLIVAIIFVCVGIYLLNKSNTFIQNAETTTAKIYTSKNPTSYKKDYDEEGDVYIDYAEYTVNGTKYYEELSKTISQGIKRKIKNGETETIYYNPNNPKEITRQTPSSKIVGYFFIIFGIIISLLSLWKILVNNKIVRPKYTDQEIQNKVLDAFTPEVYNIMETADGAIHITFNAITKILGIIFGIFIIILGLIFAHAEGVVNPKLVETTGTITKITQTQERNANNEMQIKNHVFVKYEVGDKIYESELMNSSGLKENQQVKIYYNPDFPTDVNTKNVSFIGIIIIAIGALVLITSIFRKINR